MANSRFPDAHTTWTETDARIVLDHWRRSGDSLSAFARQRGVSAARPYWWRKRLGGDERSTALISLIPAQVTGEVGSSGGFGVVVRLAKGVSIEVGDASPAWVAELIRELARPT